jgi:hypothetical protein
MMQSLRDNPPAALGGMTVLRARDFLSEEHGPLRSDTERLSRNLLAYDLEKAQVVVRPSGTEPKAKIYVDFEGGRLDGVQARQRAEELAAQVVDECIGRSGFSLSPSARLLPDYVDLDLKLQFGTAFREELKACADRLAASSRDEQLEWLRRRLAPYAPGADPLEATASALSALLKEIAPTLAGALPEARGRA